MKEKKGKVMQGNPYAEKPYTWFNEGEVASAKTPRPGSRPPKKGVVTLGLCVLSGALLAGPTLFFAGDSTLDDHGRKPCPPYASWGTTLEALMKDGCKVDNYAVSGASAKSFVTEGYWGRLIAKVKPGDFVVIQFGHNDQKHSTEYYRTKRFTSVNGTYEEYYTRFVEDVRAKGATPMFATSIVRGTFGKDGKLFDSRDENGVNLRSYADAAIALGKKLGVDVVDMNTLTRDLLQKVGKDESMKFFVISTGLIKGKDGEPAKDVSHPIKAGADAFAKLFLDDVKARELPVARLFR